MSTWTKLPALPGRQQPCLHAGVAPDLFPPDGIIAVGFGFAALLCDGRHVWSEDEGSGEAYMTGAQAEALASVDPDHDWQIVLEGPLSGRTYQRHGPNEWALVQQNEGFA